LITPGGDLVAVRRRAVRTVVAEGDLRKSLEAVRDKLAGQLDEAGPRDSAAISRQLVAVLERLDRLTGGGEESELDRIAGAVEDELAARRAHREPDTASS
jgi:hypothetical protein